VSGRASSHSLRSPVAYIPTDTATTRKHKSPLKTHRLILQQSARLTCETVCDEFPISCGATGTPTNLDASSGAGSSEPATAFSKDKAMGADETENAEIAERSSSGRAGGGGMKKALVG
jgi:hypothetical protein